MAYSEEVRQQAFGLLAQGYVPREVAEAVGVSRATISLWRAQVGGVIPEPSESSTRYLSREERYEIARLHDAGHGVREIGRRMNRAASTISRELARPRRAAGDRGRPSGRGRGYQPEACHRAAVAARARPRLTKLSRYPELKDWVQDRLNQRYSPEQIAGRLEVEFPDDDEVMSISHETIYRAIYLRPRGELRRELRAHLRTGRTQRRRRSTRQAREDRPTTGPIAGAVSITERPEEVEGRLIPGHYEGDLIVGPLGTTAAIGTLVERTSGHLTAFHLTRKTTVATIAGLTAALTRTGWPMKTLTWDRGSEMSGHAQFTIDSGVQVYFADPHAPWQRGSNESGNGLLRQYFPKGVDLADVDDDQLQTAIDQLNNRPRKRHQFRTPNEVLAGIITDDIAKTGVATNP